MSLAPTKCANPPPPSDDELHELIQPRADPESPAYKQVIAHLDRCRPCTQRLTELDSGGSWVNRQLKLPHLPDHVSGDTVGGYMVRERVAAGGQGVVYRVRDASLDRDVALKLSRSALDPEGVERFRTEARAHAGLTHPHITPLYSFGIHDGRPFFVMELAATSLSKVLHPEPPAAPTPWTAADAAVLVERLAEAVDYAHGRGIHHRDLKPQNVLLTFDVKAVAPRNVTAKLTDFGLVGAGALAGSPNYVPPEVAAASLKEASGTSPTPHQPVSPTAATTDYDGIGPGGFALIDVYGLGAILHELLVGVPPYPGTEPAAVIKAVADPAGKPVLADPGAELRVPTLPPTLRAIALKCLARDPAGRYPSAQAVADDLRRFRGREPTTAYPKNRVARMAWPVWLGCRRRPARAGLLTVLPLLLIAGTGAGYWFLDGKANRHAVEILGREEDASLRPAVDELRSAPYPLLTTLTLRRLEEELDHGGRSTNSTRRRASAAAALAMLGRTGGVWPRLGYGPDPQLRYYVIRALATAEVPPDDIAGKLVSLLSNPQEEDAGVRQALVLYFGLFDTGAVRTKAERLVPNPPALTPQLKDRLAEPLSRAYMTDPDPGVHSACEWTLRRWGVSLTDLDESLRTTRNEALFRKEWHRGNSSWRWYITDHGHTMVVIDHPGSPHVYAISTKEVTFKQFEEIEKVSLKDSVVGWAPGRPVSWINAKSAFNYCARLTAPPRPGQRHFGSWDQIVPGVAPRDLGGYRLPDRDEFVTACQGGTGLSRFFGDDAMAGWFAWAGGNAVNYFSEYKEEVAGAPVGLLMPNPWGLFDCLGNVGEICFDGPSVSAGSWPVKARGGCYDNTPGGISAVSVTNADGGRDTGFRVAFTLDAPGR